MFGLKHWEKCPNCGWDMELTAGVVVAESALNAGFAALGGLAAGPAGAIIGASLGKKKRTTMYVCENKITCGAMYRPYDFRDWKKEMKRQGLL